MTERRAPTLADCISFMAAHFSTEGRPLSSSASKFTIAEMNKAVLRELRGSTQPNEGLICHSSADERIRAMLHDLIVAVLEGRETTESEPVPKHINAGSWSKALRAALKTAKGQS